MLLNSVDRARSVKTNSKILIKNINSNLKNKDFQFLINQLKNITLIEKENLEFYIKKTIKDLDLIFIGFENINVIDKFKRKHKNPEDLYNLDIWNSFEKKNKRIFSGMYQFWCKKRKF